MAPTANMGNPDETLAQQTVIPDEILEQQTVIPDETLDQQTVTPSASNLVGRSPSASSSCTSDEREHTVVLDVRSVFPDQFVVTCTGENDTSILQRLESALNAAFPYVATAWDGNALFESFQFDFDQLVTHVEGYVPLGLVGQPCPERTIDCPPFFDTCRYSCGLLTTTNCNDMQLSGIEQLENYLSAAATASLRGLDLDCLGFQNELIAMVRVSPSG